MDNKLVIGDRPLTKGELVDRFAQVIEGQDIDLAIEAWREAIVPFIGEAYVEARNAGERT